jgi:hypothetical protein
MDTETPTTTPRVGHGSARIARLHTAVDLHVIQLTGLVAAQRRHRRFADSDVLAQFGTQGEAENVDFLRLHESVGRVHGQRRRQAGDVTLNAQHRQIVVAIHAQDVGGPLHLSRFAAVNDRFDAGRRGAVGSQHAQDVGVGRDDPRRHAEEAAALGDAAVGQADAQVKRRILDFAKDDGVHLGRHGTVRHLRRRRGDDGLDRLRRRGGVALGRLFPGRVRVGIGGKAANRQAHDDQAEDEDEDAATRRRSHEDPQAGVFFFRLVVLLPARPLRARRHGERVRFASFPRGERRFLFHGDGHLARVRRHDSAWFRAFSRHAHDAGALGATNRLPLHFLANG